tara:strand:- start:2266 stop:2556 length:291 start_codon:yes stop_codon:yes gene_type:complete
MDELDPLPVIRHHFESINLSDKERKDIEATFKSLAILLGRKALGDDVEGQLKQVKAQVLLWKSGAWATVYSAFWAAAKEYAEKLGEVLAATVKGLI